MAIGSGQGWIDIAAQTTGTGTDYATKGTIQAGSDGTLAMFHFETRPDKAATEREGRPIFRELPYVEIRLPGQNKSVINRPVKDADKERWPQAWAAFQQRQTGVIGGTPLKEWPYLTRTRVAELHAMDIFSIEQLAGMPEANALNLGPDGYDLRKRAIQHLQPDDATISGLRDENRKLKDRLSALEAMAATKQRMPAVEPEPQQIPEPVAPVPSLTAPPAAAMPEGLDPDRRKNRFWFRRIYHGYGVTNVATDEVLEKFRTKKEAESRAAQMNREFWAKAAAEG